MSISRRVRRILPLLLTVMSCGLALPAVAQLAPWWIPDQDCQLVLGGTTYWGRGPLNLVSTQDFLGITTDVHAYDEDGDLCLRYTSYYDPSWEDSGGTRFFTPYLKVLDYPLTTGKTWTAESMASALPGQLPRAWVVECEVIGPRTVETVLGPLDVIEVRQVTTVDVFAPQTKTLYLHEQLGNVYDLTSWAGCMAVSSDDVSWDALKAIYR